MPDYVLKAMFVVTGLVLLWQAAELLRRPGRKFFRFCLHALSGLAGLLTANTLGTLLGVGLGVNAVTCLVSALLGLPGVGLMYGLRYLVFV